MPSCTCPWDGLRKEGLLCAPGIPGCVMLCDLSWRDARPQLLSLRMCNTSETTWETTWEHLGNQHIYRCMPAAAVACGGLCIVCFVCCFVLPRCGLTFSLFRNYLRGTWGEPGWVLMRSFA